MGAPVAVTAALVKTRTGRRIVVGALTILFVGTAFILTPLIAIPFAVAGQSVTAAEAAARPKPVPATNGAWGYPLVGDYWKGRGFGFDPGASSCGYCSKFHEGYDMAQGCGATVHAASAGRVTTAGNYFGYGNAVAIDHGRSITTLYGHMAWGSLRVHVGEHVSTGQALGSEGSTGHSTGCHLHFEVRIHGTPVNPQPFMAARGLPLK